MIKRVKEQWKDYLLQKQNVVGVGVGYKETGGIKTEDLSVVVFVRKKVSKAALSPRDVIPSLIDGVVTDVIQVGNIEEWVE